MARASLDDLTPLNTTLQDDASDSNLITDRPSLTVALSTFAEDVFTEAEHTKINEELSNTIDFEFTPLPITNKFLKRFLHTLFLIIGGMNKAQLLPTASMKDNILEYLNNDALHAAFQQALQSGNYSKLANLAIFRNPHWRPAGDIIKKEGIQATMSSWNEEYVGTAAQALLETMKYHQGNFQSDAYAKYITIVQSSGMGKSRMIDELSKKVLVIPINLRHSNETGFPAPDHRVRDFLISNSFNDDQAEIRALSLLIALFITAEKYLQDIDSRLASVLRNIPDEDFPKDIFHKFRLFMTAGQKFSSQGELRNQFYNDVVRFADQLMRSPMAPIPSSPTTSAKNPSPTQTRFIYATSEATLTIAFEALVARIVDDPDRARTEINVVIAFDEAHTLLTPAGSPQSPTRFSALRRVLRMLRNSPVFALFLSTNGKVQEFNPPAAQDNSSRVATGNLIPFPPFTELGFDQMVDFDDIHEISISDFSKVEYMAKFGRPLFGSRYKSGMGMDKQEIVKFAAQKLLGGGSKAISMVARECPLTPAGILACMLVRLALEFTNLATAAARKREREQVESHMRVCIAVDKGFESMVTTSPSEPLLAMGARLVMKNFNLPQSLLEELQKPGIGKGFRGELVALVILILAIDETVKSDHPGIFTPTVCSIQTFMQHLLPDKPYQRLLKALPSFTRTDEEGVDFETTFKDSKIYFNHFIKLNDRSMLSRDFLYKLIARGAAVLCADYQAGADIIIPFLFRGDYLRATNVSAIFIQVKNDKTFTNATKSLLYESMNPYTLKFFEETDPDVVPVIRMVFALASPDSVVTIMEPNRAGKPRKAKQNRPPKYTSFDIWCAKASEDTFKVVKKGDEETYKNLLTIGGIYPGAYDNQAYGIPLKPELRRRMNPGTASDGDHWKFLGRKRNM